MEIQYKKFVRTIRQPEHIGENRCMPCTIVNILISLSLCLLLLYISLVVASIFLSISLSIIYLRGYLVPGTPTITKKYFPTRLLSIFDETIQNDSTSSNIATEKQIDPQIFLREHGIVQECETADDVCINEQFKEEWMDHIYDIVREDWKDGISKIMAVDERSISCEINEDSLVVESEGVPIGQWESEAALVSDIAGHRVLQTQYSAWTELDTANRSQILTSLRIFLENCPQCHGTISVGEETVESCCRSYDVVASTCVDCNSRIMEVEAGV